MAASEAVALTAEQQFWLNWWVYFGTAVGTILTVIVALFGPVLKPRPKLVTRLADPKGLKTPVTGEIVHPDPNGGEPKRTTAQGHAVWFHIKVANRWRWFSAHEVQVFLTSVEEPDSADQYQTVWVGEIPLKWANGLPSVLTKTVGAEGTCDLCSVHFAPELEAPEFTLHPLIWPFALPIRRSGKTHLRLTVQAKSVEADARPVQIKVDWDGTWSEDREEMARKLVVKEVRTAG